MKKLYSMENQRNVEGMERFGIKHEKNLGISVTDLRKFAKQIGREHELALKLWNTGIRDARMVAACIEDPKTISEEQVESWLRDIKAWDLCDHCCGHLFDKTPFAYEKALEWSKRKEEFQKRAGFSIVAWLAVHDKKKGDKWFENFLEIIRIESTDSRNYVKKAVNWALRQIGKRNWDMNKKAIKTAEKILKIDDKTAKWNARDAIRELTCKKVKVKLNKKNI
jgi:3-methyladenine DNA glycosylase AlkD